MQLPDIPVGGETTHRESLAPLITLGTMLAISVLGRWSVDAATLKPNIVVIYTDDQGYGDVSAMNPQCKFKTPNLDRLIREGLNFTDGHCSDTVCTPSRYGLLTGRYSWRTRLKAGVMGAEGECLIARNRMTLGSLLQDHGYNTAMVGKWHLGMEFVGDKGKGDRDWSQPVIDGPHARGFDYFFGIPASMNYGVLAYFQNDRVTVPPAFWTSKKPGDNKPDPASYRITPPYEDQLGPRATLEVASNFDDVKVLESFLDKAVQWIGQVAPGARTGTPFFLYLPLTSPHKPVIAQKQFIGKSQAGMYGDFMVETDYRVGEVLDALDREGLAENTLVVFSSDNGAEKTYRQRIEQFKHRSNGVLRGGKRDIYEGGHRVPFIVRWPAIIQAGRTCDETVSQTDLLATFADMLGAKLPKDAGEDSFSLLPAFTGQKHDKPLRGLVIHHSSAGYLAIREGDWKLNLLPGGKGGGAKFELFNLKSDLSETKDLSGANPEKVSELRDRITQIVRNGRSTPGPAVENDGAPWWRQLVWLDAPAGYKARARKPRGNNRKAK